MNTIGQIIKDARAKKNYSIGKIEEITKIRKSFISDIEKENWNALPPFPTVLGFVKSLAGALDINEKSAVAILKRDYPPKSLNINPKPDVSSRFSWNPKLTFIIGVGIILFIILGYLGFQYIKFISPPKLTVESPKQNQVITGDSVLVFGTTDTDVKLIVNNQPVLVDDNGKFSTTIEVTPDTKEIIIEAVSRSGKETKVDRKISVQ